MNNEFKPQSYSPILNKILCFYLKAGKHPFRQKFISLITNFLGNKKLDLKTKYGFKIALDVRNLIQKTISFLP